MPVVLIIPNFGLFIAGLILVAACCACMVIYHAIRIPGARRRQAAHDAEFYRTHELDAMSGRIRKVRD